MNRLLLSLFFTACSLNVLSQTFSLKGTVHDASNGELLPSATVSLLPLERHVQTNAGAAFEFNGLLRGKEYRLQVRRVGFKEFLTSFVLTGDTVLHIKLQPVLYQLDELVVNAAVHDSPGVLETVSVEEIGRAYLLRNNAANLAQTLSSLPGIASMDIGAGFSKPVIRGMAFNRIAVVDKGIVQQDQQWGADHGWEVDQYDVDRVRVYKGPLSLFYGSDAIGGVIEILPASVPKDNKVWGDATFIAKSNNDLLGTSVMASMKRGNWFGRARITVQDYADYRIPADTITYLSWKMPVYRRQMKNTAGKEYNASLSVNFNNENINSWLHASNMYGKNGFFPGSHGIPVWSRLQPDASRRNVEMPSSFSRHFKLINNTIIRLLDAKLFVDAGFQQNLRRESSLFHTHYGSQQPPPVNPDVELSFLLNTYSLNARVMSDEEKKWSKTIGIFSEYQYNRVGGYSFLLPDFNRFSTGVFFLNRFTLHDRFSWVGGVRYDVGNLRVMGWYDAVLEEYLTRQGYSEDDVKMYARRAGDLRKTFTDFSGSVGFVFTPNLRHALKMNAGKSFRYPSANELASNGVHHGAFRHEIGTNRLVSENGYQLDLAYEFQAKHFSLKVNPFVSYFSNYIYLAPTGQWSILPHTGQIFRYNQSRAFMAGGELSAEYAFGNGWSISSDIEYTSSYNLSDRYPLPFSPPAVITSHIAYSGNLRKTLSFYLFRMENRFIFAQNHIARNELRTPGASLFNASAYLQWKVNGMVFVTDVQVHNIFDMPFLNHLSFYRKLNAPEPGRNIQLILKIPF